MKTLKFQVLNVLVDSWTLTRKKVKNAKKNVKAKVWASPIKLGESSKGSTSPFVLVCDTMNEIDEDVMKELVHVLSIIFQKERITA